MPTSEPLPDAPAAIWASGSDAALYFNTIGMPFLAPIAAAWGTRMVITEELCALPPPAASPITLVDIAESKMIWDPERQLAAEKRLQAWVDRGLWEGNCRYTDATPMPTTEPQDPPAGYPGDPPPSARDLEQVKMFKWIQWMVRQILPRETYKLNLGFISGTGHLAIPSVEGGEWEVRACGVALSVTAKPDFMGHSDGGDFPVYHNLGWVSLDDGFSAHSPIKVAHTDMHLAGEVPWILGMHYNLRPDVTVFVEAIYPITATGVVGG